MITSTHLKSALLHYCRYKRQWICADEVTSDAFIADVLIDTGRFTIEAEIKMTKSDLINGEKKKRIDWGKGINKHDAWPIVRPNKFALCVPKELEQCAEEWIQQTNKKYGLFVYSQTHLPQDSIWVKKSAQLLHKVYGNVDYKERIAQRLSSCRCLELEKIIYKIKD